ncbi:MAG: hypothetical protein J6S26_00855 [Solobacterium sp.]|nr:hypothetical protein [Solobacterium sp.]
MTNKYIHAHWIHDKIRNDKYVTGYLFLPDARCSNCGQKVRSDLFRCPKCKAIMDEKPE